MHFEEYRRYDAMGLADLVKRKEVHPSELLNTAMTRAEQVNPKINAVIRWREAQAKARVQQPFDSHGLFAGVPFLTKDLLQEIKGEVCAQGSRVLKDAIATETSDVTRKWLDQGLVIFGVTNTPEFGSKGTTEPLLFGPSRNPWDVTRTTGGSSGGSAAAVAAGIVPMAGANDGGGSIRIPAAACGLFGLKAGRGVVSVGPTIAEGFHGGVAQGVVTRSVRDSAAMLDVLQGPLPHSPYLLAHSTTSYLDIIRQAPRKLRIGFSVDSPIGTPVHADARQAVHDTATLLTSLGHDVEEASPPVDGKQVAQDFLTAWSVLIGFFVEEARQKTGTSLQAFEPDTRSMTATGRTVSGLELMTTLNNWHTHTRVLADFHSTYDMWLSPTISDAAIPIGLLETPAWLSTLSDVAGALGLAGITRRTSAFQNTLLNNLAWTPFTNLARLLWTHEPNGECVLWQKLVLENFTSTPLSSSSRRSA